MKVIAFILVGLALFAPFVFAEQGHLKLLAVATVDGIAVGSEADLFLEIERGRGRVFLDTFPLTRLDTQISTRFAKQIACSFLDVDCSGFDFIYRLRSDASILGGPSAGAALAVLTVSMLDNQQVNDDIGITGTINSGGVIGAVGDVKPKIELAQRIGLKKILIPAGTREYEESDGTNTSIDLVQFGKKIGIDVQEISTLNEALFAFTGKQYEEDSDVVVINKLYETTMKNLAQGLCDRSDALLERVDPVDQSRIDSIKNATNRALASFEGGMYYSSASFCFKRQILQPFLGLTQFS